MDSIPSRLKALRNRTVPKVSIRAVAAELGVPSSTYAAYEDEAKFKKPILPLDLAKKLADIFEPKGVDRAETLALAGITGELSVTSRPPRSAEEMEWVEVTGTVAAGVWREQSDWSEAERYDVRFGPPPFPGAERFALRMEGLSMNRTIPPGSDLECLRVIFSSIVPEPGSLVIVERTAHDLTELTCKRLARDGDNWLLLAESTEPEFQTPIPIGKPDEGMFTDNETRVVGIVLSAKQDLAPPGLGARRYKNRT